MFVFINGIEHFHFDRKNYVHRQAWKEPGEGAYYYIEICFKDCQPLELHYDNPDTWRRIIEILTKINKHK